jgi:hypothetical protein
MWFFFLPAFEVGADTESSGVGVAAGTSSLGLAHARGDDDLAFFFLPAMGMGVGIQCYVVTPGFDGEAALVITHCGVRSQGGVGDEISTVLLERGVPPYIG